MISNKYYLGDLITQRREKNPGGNLPIRGVSKNGLQPPKQIDADTSIYNVYYRKDFVYNPARMELGSIAFNDEFEKAICSSLYEVFFVHRTDLVIPEYLALFVKNPEFARYCDYIGSGSAREYCRFDNISKIPISLPSIDEQLKIVYDYQAITERIDLLQKINRNLEDLAYTAYLTMIEKNKEECVLSNMEKTANITTGKLNSEDAVDDGIYPFFTCSQETYKTDTYAFDQEAVLLAGNNASAIYPLKIFKGKFNAYQRTYVISSTHSRVSNKQLYFVLKQKLKEFRKQSNGTATKFLTMTILSPISVLIPPERAFNDFSEIADRNFNLIAIHNQELSTLKSLRAILLQNITKGV